MIRENYLRLASPLGTVLYDSTARCISLHQACAHEPGSEIKVLSSTYMNLCQPKDFL